MRISLIGLASILTIWMVNSSCERVKPEAPPHSTLDSTLHTPQSVLRIPIQYDVAKLEEMTNSRILGTFIDEKIPVNDKGDSLHLQIEKRGPILLSWKSPTLHCSFPLKVSGKYFKRIGKNLTLKNNEPVDMEIVLHLSTRLGLDKDWQLKTTSTLEEISWVREPKLKVLGVKFNLRKQVENAIKKNKTRLIAKLDQTIPPLLNTRKAIEKLWLDIQKPIRINKKGVQVWLKAYGENMAARLIDEGPDQISIHVRLNAYLQTVIEGETIPASNPTLPPYAMAQSSDDTLSMFLRVNLPFSLANDILKKELVGKSLKAEGYSTTIRDIDVYGSDRGLAVKVKVKGDVDGIVYFTATPGYDTANATLFAREFGFDIDTENALVTSANWLMHDDVIKNIKEKLKIDVTPYIDTLPHLIIDGIERGRIGEKIELEISSFDVKPVQSLITADGFQLVFYAAGNARISLEQKVFARRKRIRTKK
jgi:hypothetical protein